MTAEKRRNTRRTVNKPFVAFSLTLLLVGGIIGGAVVSVANAIWAKAEESKGPSAGAPYGTRDGKTIQGELPYEYLSNNDFVPLDCGLSEDLQEYTYPTSFNSEMRSTSAERTGRYRERRTLWTSLS